jgi:hypothetical protein
VMISPWVLFVSRWAFVGAADAPIS